MPLGHHRLPFFSGLLSLVLVTSSAKATPDISALQGVRASTMGGAVVAGGDDHWAGWYNIANIGSTDKKLQLGFDVAGIYNNATYVRRDDGQLAASFTLKPKFGGGLTYNPVPHLSLGLHYYGLYQATQDFTPAQVAGNTVTADMGSAQHILEFGLAIHLNHRLSLGLGLRSHLTTIRQKLLLTTATPGDSLYDKGNDLLADLAGHDFSQFSAVFGLTVKPTANWAIGFSLHLPSTTSVKGTVTVGGKEGIFKLKMEQPITTRLGIRYTKPRHFAVELAAAYHQLSVAQELTWQLLKLDFPIYNQTMELARTDRFSIHLGGSYQLLEQLELRAGIMYQNNTVADAYLSPYNYDSHQVALGFGPSYRCKFGLRIDAGYTFYYFVERNEAVSKNQPFNVLPADTTQRIGNGTYGFGVHTFGLSLAYDL